MRYDSLAHVTKEITVGLLWHSFSSDNLGVGALSESQIAICEKVAERMGVSVRFIVFGFGGRRSYIPAGKNIRSGKQISLKELLTGRSPFWGEVGECDAVLDIGEGDSFADIYGKRRFRMQMATKLAVILKGKPLVLSPQTIGPFDKSLSRMLARFVMNRCEVVIARDNLSFSYLKTLGIRSPLLEAIDVAFRLPFTRPEKIPSGKVRVGLNVSGLLYSGGYEGANQFGLTIDYRALVNELIQYWLGDTQVELWLVPHVLADDIPRDDDQVAIRELVEHYPAARVAPAFRSPSEAKSFISGLDFLTGARMHACIAAFSSGVPVVPLAYSRKFNGLFSSLGYEWLADGKKMTTEEAKACIVEGYRRRKDLATAIADAGKIVEKKLNVYEDFLGGLYAKVSEQSPLQ
jgi:colanic acid/amylovoran biosynthesis protein